jgi:hypothetical protein
MNLKDLSFYCTSGKIAADNYYYINAFKTWNRLGINITLFGPDDKEFRKLLDKYNIVWCHEPELHSSSKLPFLSDLLQTIINVCETEYMCYINCDIMIFEDFLKTFSFLKENVEDFFMVGQRWDWLNPISIDDNMADAQIIEIAKSNGRLHSKGGIDYFAFKKDILGNISVPCFLIPRCRWDHWLTGISKKKGVPLINTTSTNFVIHSEPLCTTAAPNGRAYWGNKEVQYNERLYTQYGGCDIGSADMKTDYNKAGEIILQ